MNKKSSAPSSAPVIDPSKPRAVPVPPEPAPPPVGPTEPLRDLNAPPPPPPPVETGAGEPSPPADGGGAPSPVVPDPAAPYGRKADGTPASKRGRKPKTGTSEEGIAADAVNRAVKKARLSTVRPNPSPAQGTPGPMGMSALIGTDYDALGKELAGIWFLAGTLLLGPDWQPEPAEGAAIEKAFTQWARARQLPPLSPDYALIGALSVYSLSRIQRPTVRERISKGWEWIKSKAGAFRFR